MENIVLPTKQGGWMGNSIVEETLAPSDIVELKREEIEELIKENESLSTNIALLQQKHKIKHLSDIMVYLSSIENSLNQLL